MQRKKLCYKSSFCNIWISPERYVLHSSSCDEENTWVEQEFWIHVSNKTLTLNKKKNCPRLHMFLLLFYLNDFPYNKHATFTFWLPHKKIKLSLSMIVFYSVYFFKLSFVTYRFQIISWPREQRHSSRCREAHKIGGHFQTNLIYACAYLPPRFGLIVGK